MNHYQALKQLMPIDLGEVSNKDMEIEGALYDDATEATTKLLPEFFPSTVDALLSRWEAEYGIIPRQGAGIEERRANLRARYITIGNLSKAYFKSIAQALGYEVEITEGGELYNWFRASISRAGDPVYSASAMWSWTVTTKNKKPGRDIVDTFKDLNPPHMRLEFAYEP